MAKNTVVTGSRSTPTSHLKAFVKVCKSSVEVSESVEVDASVAVSYGVFKSDAKSKYLHELDLTTYTVTIVMYASRQETVSRDTVSIPQAIVDGLTDDAKIRDFVGQNGDSWVSRVTLGSEYIGTFVFKSRSLKEQSDVEVAVSAAGVVAGVAIDASLSTKLKNALKDSKVEYEIRNFVAGTTLAGRLPGNSVDDIDKMVEFALNFPGFEANQAASVSFAVEPYERLLGSKVNFSPVTKNRRSFLGNVAKIGSGETAIRLQEVLNAGVSIQRLYDFYGWSDNVFSERVSQVRDDFSNLLDYIADIDADPVAVLPFTPPESAKWAPEPNFIVKIPVKKSFLNGGGGGFFQDVHDGDVSQLVRLTSFEIQSGSWIDQIVANYSTREPARVFFFSHGTPGGSGKGKWELSEGDWVTSMHGFMTSHVGIYDVGGLHFRTFKGHNWYTGPEDDAKYTEHWDVGPNQVFVGFAGWSGSSVDCLQPLVVEFSATTWSPIREEARYLVRDFAPVRVQNTPGNAAYDQTVLHGTTSGGVPIQSVSCGPFGAGVRPAVGIRYRLTLTENHVALPPINMYCTFSGETSQFNINQ